MSAVCVCKLPLIIPTIPEGIVAICEQNVELFHVEPDGT